MKKLILLLYALFSFSFCFCQTLASSLPKQNGRPLQYYWSDQVAWFDSIAAFNGVPFVPFTINLSASLPTQNGRPTWFYWSDQIAWLDSVIAAQGLPVLDTSKLPIADSGLYVTVTRLNDSLPKFFRNGGNTFSGRSLLGNTNNNSLDIETNNSIKMTVDSAGMIGINTTQPRNIVDVRMGADTIKLGLATYASYYINFDTALGSSHVNMGTMRNPSGAAFNFAFGSTKIINWTFGQYDFYNSNTTSGQYFRINPSNDLFYINGTSGTEEQDFKFNGTTEFKIKNFASPNHTDFTQSVIGDIRFLPNSIQTLDVTSANDVLISSSTTDDGSGKLQIDGNVSLRTAGNKLLIKTGTNASFGTAILSTGAVTVNTSVVTNNSLIFTSCMNCVNCGFYSISAIVAGNTFVITSSNVADGSTVAWWIVDKQ